MTDINEVENKRKQKRSTGLEVDSLQKDKMDKILERLRKKAQITNVKNKKGGYYCISYRHEKHESIFNKLMPI